MSYWERKEEGRGGKRKEGNIKKIMYLPVADV